MIQLYHMFQPLISGLRVHGVDDLVAKSLYHEGVHPVYCVPAGYVNEPTGGEERTIESTKG